MNTKKLKQLVLDLAIHGKLVPQDPNDEPASELLERIVETHGRASNIGRASNKKIAISSEEIDEVPFEVPEGWVWCRLNSIVSVLGDGIHGTPKYDKSGDYYFINGNNLSHGKIHIKYDTKRVSKEEAIKYMKLLDESSVLVSINGTIGNISFYNGEKIILGKSACFFNLVDSSLKEYIRKVLETSFFLKYALDVSTGSTIKNVPLAGMRNFPIPLPPLSEQRRIVSEIEKWFGIIDQLESNEADLRKSIEQTKKKVLDLAIHGKLVPQDPNDEPASELLKRIVETHGRASNIGRASNKKSAISSEEIDEVPFEVPEGWVWCRLGEINEYKSGNVNPLNNKDTEYELYSVPIYSSGFPEITKGKNIGSSKQIVEKNDVLLCKINPHLNRVWVVFHFKEELQCLASSEWVVLRSSITLPEYLRYVLMSEYFRTLLNSNVSGVGGSLTRAQPSFIEKYIIPLPPLSEQRRIVAKIEEVFGELDRMLEMIG